VAFGRGSQDGTADPSGLVAIAAVPPAALPSE